MGSGERGKVALACGWEKNMASTTRKLSPLALSVGIFFRGVAMAFAILHNVLIGLFCVGIVAYKRGGTVLYGNIT